MRVLLIGGTDSSGGAGLARDIATAGGMGAETCIAVTAVTAQTDNRVTTVQVLPPQLISEQVATADNVDAVKIGMLGSASIVTAVARALPDVPVVVDPVLAATSARVLLDQAGMDALFADLLPHTTLLTPNLPELRLLSDRLGLDAHREEANCVQALIACGCDAVLVKGGHAKAGSTCEDRLYRKDGAFHIFRGPRYNLSLRGTGCQLASAISVALGRGDDVAQAVNTARARLMERFTNGG